MEFKTPKKNLQKLPKKTQKTQNLGKKNVVASAPEKLRVDPPATTNCLKM